MKTHIVFWLAVFLPAWALGWGQYGHEQINGGAVRWKAVANSKYGKCIAKNEDYLTRLGITPDYEWKRDTQRADLSPELKRRRDQNDFWEHPLHFFSADAFVVDAVKNASMIGKLPGGPFSTVAGSYEDLMAKNASFVMLFNGHPKTVMRERTHATLKEVTESGTAPWRARQLYELAVATLKKGSHGDSTARQKSWQEALLYLGTMGHYVGDMSQPFHATLIFDGQAYRPDAPKAEGVHSVVDTGALEILTHNLKHDPQTMIYPSFRATEGQVLKHASGLHSGNVEGQIAPNDIVPAVLGLAETGYPYVAPLVKSFAESRAKLQPARPVVPGSENTHSTHGHFHERIKPQVVRDFLERPISAPGAGEIRLEELLAKRMAESVVLLGRLWVSALEAAQVDPNDCPAVDFDVSVAITKYPVPSYIGQ